MFLGYEPKNSTFIVARWKIDERRKAGDKWVFSAEENASVDFNEDILIQDINDLKPGSKSIRVHVPVPAMLRDPDAVIQGSDDRKSDDLFSHVVRPGGNYPGAVIHREGADQDSKISEGAPAASEREQGGSVSAVPEPPAPVTLPEGVEVTPEGVAIKRGRGRPKGYTR